MQPIYAPKCHFKITLPLRVFDLSLAKDSWDKSVEEVIIATADVVIWISLKELIQMLMLFKLETALMGGLQFNVVNAKAILSGPISLTAYHSGNEWHAEVADIICKQLPASSNNLKHLLFFLTFHQFNSFRTWLSLTLNQHVGKTEETTTKKSVSGHITIMCKFLRIFILLLLRVVGRSWCFLLKLHFSICFLN